MKTITEILEEVAERNGFENWATAFQRSDKYDISDYHREAAEIYANQSRCPPTLKEINIAANSKFTPYYSAFTSEQVQLDRSRTMQISAFKDGVEWASTISPPKHSPRPEQHGPPTSEPGTA